MATTASRWRWSVALLFFVADIVLVEPQFYGTNTGRQQPTRPTLYGRQPFYRHPFESRDSQYGDTESRYEGRERLDEEESPRRNLPRSVDGKPFDRLNGRQEVKTSPLTSKTANKSNSIESSLAAIFRGVAYGVSSAPTTTTPTPTTTTTTTTPPPPSSKSPNNPKEGSGDSSGDHVEPVQHVDNNNNNEEPKPIYIPSSSPVTTPSTEVQRAGMEDWQTGLQGAWEVHVYCSAASFSLLAIISLLCIVRVHMSAYLLTRGYYITAHLLVFLASFFRCVSFFHDPYASGSKLPDALSDVLFNIGTPCMTAAFSVVVLALLNSARIILLPLNLQSPIVFGTISGVYIASNIIVDIVAGIYSSVKWTEALRASVQALTAGWTGAMCLGYMIIFYRIEKAAARQRHEMMRLSYNRENMESYSTLRRLPTLALSRGARLILVASLCGLAVSVLQVYGLMTPDGLIQLPPKEPWMWFGYQTSCRLLEIIMWCCICVAAALSSNSTFDKQTNDDHSLVAFSCKKCTSCSDISSCQESPDKKLNENLYPSMCNPNMVSRNFSVDVNGKLLTEECSPLARMTYSPGHRDSEKLSRKSNTLHSATSDMHLLWAGQQSNSSTSRPASMVFNENGMVRFRTQNENGEIQRGPFPNEEIPPGYIEAPVYNMAHHDKTSYTLGRMNHSQMSQFQRNRAYARNTIDKRLMNSDANSEYNYCEIPADIINNEYAAYANALPSNTAANNFEGRLYSDYEVASYYHSPINIPASSTSSHVYDSLRPKVHTNLTPRKIRNFKIPTSSCLSSPRSIVSTTGSHSSPKNSAIHNSDSDLCSSATDRTQVSLSQGHDARNDLNEVSLLQRPVMKRHLSHPEQMQSTEDNDRSKPPHMTRQNCHNQMTLNSRNTGGDVTALQQSNSSSPCDSDDLYTPLMGEGDHDQSQPPKNNTQMTSSGSSRNAWKTSPHHNNYDLRNEQLMIQRGMAAHPQLGHHILLSPSKTSQGWNVNLDQSYKSSVSDANAETQKFLGNPSSSSSSISPEFRNNQFSTGLVSSPLRQSSSHQNPSDPINSKQVSPSHVRLPADLISENSSTFDEDIYQNDAIVGSMAGPLPPPIPAPLSQAASGVQSRVPDGIPTRGLDGAHTRDLDGAQTRTSDAAQTWVHQSRDGGTKTEFVRKPSRKGNKSVSSPTNSTGSPTSPVSNL